MFRALFNPLQRSNVRDYWKKEKKKKTLVALLFERKKEKNKLLLQKYQKKINNKRKEKKIRKTFRLRVNEYFNFARHYSANFDLFNDVIC